MTTKLLCLFSRYHSPVLIAFIFQHVSALILSICIIEPLIYLNPLLNDLIVHYMSFPWDHLLRTIYFVEKLVWICVWLSFNDVFRHDSGGSIFSRRLDYSSFNVLPKQKINSYHIKMEDECSIGNDETRIFILSNLASNKLNKVPCVLCNALMCVYDRYPLINGTFFLSPRQHNRTCIQVRPQIFFSRMTISLQKSTFCR